MIEPEEDPELIQAADMQYIYRFWCGLGVVWVVAIAVPLVMWLI